MGREWEHGDDRGKGGTRERDRVDGQMNWNMGWKGVGGWIRWTLDRGMGWKTVGGWLGSKQGCGDGAGERAAGSVLLDQSAPEPKPEPLDLS